MTNASHYETLKIENTASAEEIKRAYYKLVRQFPPERFPEEFVALKEAYETLSDAARRKSYDAKLKRQNELAGDLPAEALLQIEQAKKEIENTHTGKAVKIAEDLYAKYPDNAAVISLLHEAYLARGWTNKAMDLLLSPAYKKTLKTSKDWQSYTDALGKGGFPDVSVFAATIEGMAELAKTGADDIEMCAWAYFEFLEEFTEMELLMVSLPEKFDTPDKILHHISELAKRGLKSNNPEIFVNDLLSPTINKENASKLEDRGIARIRTVLDIIHTAVDLDAIKKTGIYEVIKAVEHIVEQYSEPEYQLEPVRSGEKIGRNDPCPCGSGKKYKKCCGR